MGFIRTKKISGNEYAYLVENKWYKQKYKGKGRGSRQKVTRYMGRVYRFDKVIDKDFSHYVGFDFQEYVVNNTQESVIKELVRWELFRHNVDSVFNVDFNGKKVFRNNKEVSLKINEGFLNGYTLRRLFNLKSGKSYYLAKCFVEAGIDIPKEVFVGLFSE
jgi:hypothetical protein